MAQEQQKQQSQQHTLVCQEHSTLSKEIQRIQNRFKNQERYYSRSNSTCGQADYRKCCGDCGLCVWRKEGRIMMFGLWDSYEFDYLMDHEQIDPVTDEVLTKDLLQHICDFADHVTKAGGFLVRQYLVEGRSLEEVAHAAGLKPTTAWMRIDKALKEIRKHREKFLD